MSLRNQLIGTWKSDRKRTLAGFAPYHKLKDLAKRRRVSGIFGELEVKYTRRYIHSQFKDSAYKERYEVVDESEDTLVIKVDEKYPELFDTLNGLSFYVIQFDETRYHKYMSVYVSRWHYVEWFRKVETA